MKTINRTQIPKDYIYYRSSSEVFFDYYKNYTRMIVEKIWKWFEFLTAYKIIFNFFVVTIEKIDIEVNKKFLKNIWIPHGIIYRTPRTITEKPIGWHRIPTFFTRFILHSSRSAFSILNQADYWEKWSSKAKAHRRKILQNISDWTIKIEKISKIEDYLEIYKNTKIKDPNKEVVYRVTKKLFTNTKTSYSIFIAFVNKKPLAWAVFINEWVTSEYRCSFYHEDSKPYHLWVAIMDAWFADSFKNWIKYCDLDHMRDEFQFKSYSWYTKFKESIADFDVYFHDTWIKIF